MIFARGETMAKRVSLKNLGPRLPKIINDINSKMTHFIITKNDKPIALILSINNYESLMETLSVLSDKNLMKRIKQADRDVKKGRLKTLEEIKGKKIF